MCLVRNHFALPKTGESLLDKYPTLCIEWDIYNSLGPENYKSGSNTKAFWKCKKCKFQWQSSIKHRAHRSVGCPACAGVVTTDKNRLSLLRPDLVKEWDYVKNKDFPSDFCISSNKKKWWICSKCNNNWKAYIYSRTNAKQGCPKCKKSQGEKSIEDWLQNNNINYQIQYKISECKNILPLSFDFAIWINNELRLIEYNGLQHYKPMGCWGNNTKFDRTVKNDKIKQDYCKSNNIPLLIIPHTEFNNIEQLLKDFI